VDIHSLPALNAVLNASSAVLLVIGHRLILARKMDAHKKVMIGAFCVSIAFLVSYLIYHWNVGSVHYPHTGVLRWIYLTILFTHTLLAASVPVLAIVTLRRGLKGRFSQHVKIARWTYPIWLYVSVTGVVVYLMLYQF
jgi:uncharacterized membrane protein YozB (DUF420 family)